MCCHSFDEGGNAIALLACPFEARYILRHIPIRLPFRTFPEPLLTFIHVLPQCSKVNMERSHKPQGNNTRISQWTKVVRGLSQLIIFGMVKYTIPSESAVHMRLRKGRKPRFPVYVGKHQCTSQAPCLNVPHPWPVSVTWLRAWMENVCCSKGTTRRQVTY